MSGAKRETSAAPLPTRVFAVIYALALALWAGGLTVLGAIVAPTVFGIVPAPTSADAMTVVFRRFDVVAMTCGVIALLAEAGLAWSSRRSGLRVGRLDLARGAASVGAALLAIALGTWLSPQIQALHHGGAVRGWNAAGQELERLHRLAEKGAKVELVLLLGAIVLLVSGAFRHARCTNSKDLDARDVR